CGLIAGSVPFIFTHVKGKAVKPGMIAAFLVFFLIVIAMALMGETEGAAADVSFSLLNVIKLLAVGIIAAATMVVPGVSGSMMLMVLGYYNTILESINDFVEAALSLDMPVLIENLLILVPFGIGVVIGIFLIAKIIEFIFQRAETHAYWAILGLILASPIAILLKTDWSGFSVVAIVTGAVTFAIGWFIASKLGDE
ncbi:undecaprenyl phosphate translocase family protein, partial [Massilistercora timonensis]|uniref:undecaprenyl phosphate translocase family protein n=1 Tax=Massilistercora timonensis TaxID=2086584 RepID=UPI003AB843C4